MNAAYIRYIRAGILSAIRAGDPVALDDWLDVLIDELEQRAIARAMVQVMTPCAN